MILIKNGNIIDVINSKIYKTNIVINNKTIFKIGDFDEKDYDYTEIINAENNFLVPGLIDAHCHNEMTMLSPISFAELIIPTGTTSIILDCHDLANTIGIKEALKFNQNEFKNTPLKVFNMIPICIPSNPNTENCHKTSDSDEIIEIINTENITGIAEVMDVKGILDEDKKLIKILNEAKKRGLLIDGHSPELTGENLTRYIKNSGVSTDHEFTSTSEAIEKIKKGLKLILRRGNTIEPNAKELIEEIKEHSLKSDLMLSTDGCTTPQKIIKEGYMDYAIRTIIKEGVSPIEAIKMSTINTANHYNLKNIGALKEGYNADILIVNDLNNFNITKVIVNGIVIKKENHYPRNKHDEQITNTIKKSFVNKEDFQLIPEGNLSKYKVNTIKLKHKSLITEKIISELEYDEYIKADSNKDILYLSVINRYEPNGKIINGFINGFGLKKGAICCSNAQDAQNLIVIGTNHEDMANSVNEVIKLQGGCVISENNEIINKINLPIAGIMSDENPFSFSKLILNLENELKKRGCQIENPLFTISLCLTVSSIPEIKMTDKGLYDVNKNKFVDIILNENK